MLVVGVDIVEIDRIARALERWGERFLRRIYTPQERDYCRRRPPQLAARFAAKEAVMKALGTGRFGLSWRDIEVYRERGRPPVLRLHNRALERARSLGLGSLALSLSHSRHYAIAFVVGERLEGRHR